MARQRRPIRRPAGTLHVSIRMHEGNGYGVDGTRWISTRAQVPRATQRMMVEHVRMRTRARSFTSAVSHGVWVDAH
jgi:hypothetical protein